MSERRVEKDVCVRCGQTIWFREGYWVDTIDPDSGYRVAHLCDRAPVGASRHVPRGGMSAGPGTRS